MSDADTSDGGPWFRDPTTFAIQRSIDVTDHGEPVAMLNELEWINGEIWANVWMTDRIVRIDPESGTVLGWIDLTGLLRPEDRGSEPIDVLNGIAYDKSTGRIYVTGKLWPVIYEIQIVPGTQTP